MEQDNIVLRCASCGTKNRILKTKLKEGPICGKCRSPLKIKSAIDHTVDVTDETFNKEVLSSPGPVLVDCWAAWCGPCKMVAPVLNRIASEFAGRIKIAKLNVDENPATASRYSIQSIPTLLLFNNGAQIDRAVGALPKHEIESFIKRSFK